MFLWKRKTQNIHKKINGHVQICAKGQRENETERTKKRRKERPLIFFENGNFAPVLDVLWKIIQEGNGTRNEVLTILIQMGVDMIAS